MMRFYSRVYIYSFFLNYGNPKYVTMGFFIIACITIETYSVDAMCVGKQKESGKLACALSIVGILKP
jgi:hypothetical protein